jgi:hypothetical protein
MIECLCFDFVGWQGEDIADALKCFAFDEVNCRVPIEFLFFVQLLAQENLLALQIRNRLLDHPAQKVAGELAFRIM